MIERLGQLHSGMHVYYYDNNAYNLSESFKSGVVQRFEPFYAFGYAKLYLKCVTPINRQCPISLFYDMIMLQLTNDYHVATPLFTSLNEIIDHSVSALKSTISELESLKEDEES